MIQLVNLAKLSYLVSSGMFGETAEPAGPEYTDMPSKVVRR